MKSAEEPAASVKLFYCPTCAEAENVWTDSIIVAQCSICGFLGEVLNLSTAPRPPKSNDDRTSETTMKKEEKMSSDKKLSTVHRKLVHVGEPFTAPANLTFGFQEARQAFSVWYLSDDTSERRYVVLGTGSEYAGLHKVVATTCVDGFHVFHLCELL